MRLLLDSHALIWWWIESPRLSRAARTVLTAPENDIFVSTASVWEIATKYRVGKLPEIEDLEGDYDPLMARNAFISLPVTEVHAMKAGLLPGEHRDPFDRMIAAQALIAQPTVVTVDPALAAFGCAVIW